MKAVKCFSYPLFYDLSRKLCETTHEDRHGEGREDTEQKARYEAVDTVSLRARTVPRRHADVHGPDARDADGLQIPQLSGNQRDEDDPRRLRITLWRNATAPATAY